ncbi:MAG: hypothetical protein KME59_22865 [Trichormus sp. ATA11-4-KO1]|jgi:hypothetical protein|nr:hypothetical protein [Trichormus sp. ATA11-4-KO1]
MSIYEAMPSTKPRVVVYLDEETLDKLKAWAEEERRTVNNLVKIFIEDAIANKEKKQSNQEGTK